MKKSFSAADILKPSLILFAICLVASALLGFTNKVTAPKIDELKAKTERESRLLVLPDAADFEEKDGYCVGKDPSGGVAGYVFTTVTKGYGGDVSVMTGVDSSGKVTGIEILELSETAGLGMNAQKQEFKDQFKGLSGTLGVSKNAPGENEIKALTGATITSKAVTSAVNEALARFESVKGGGNNG